MQTLLTLQSRHHDSLFCAQGFQRKSNNQLINFTFSDQPGNQSDSGVHPDHPPLCNPCVFGLRGNSYSSNWQGEPTYMIGDTWFSASAAQHFMDTLKILVHLKYTLLWCALCGWWSWANVSLQYVCMLQTISCKLVTIAFSVCCQKLLCTCEDDWNSPTINHQCLVDIKHIIVCHAVGMINKFLYISILNLFHHQHAHTCSKLKLSIPSWARK